MPINVAVLGIGNHARRNILPALANCKSVVLAGISSRNRDIVEQEADRYRCKVYEDGNEILADKNINVIHIALPIGLHADWGLKTIQSGKHLWCEKSLTHDPVMTQHIIQEAKSRNLSVCECFMYIHHPQFERLRQLMRDGQIGTIKSISARFGFPHMAANNIRYNKELGGGALLDAGCYPLHAVRQLTGSMPEQIHSIILNEEPYTVDVRGSALLGFDSGLQAHLQWGYGHSYLNEIELWGDNGRARAMIPFSKPATRQPCIKIINHQGEIAIENFPDTDHFLSMFDSFSVACSDPVLRATYWSDAIQQSRIMQEIAN